MVVLLKWVVRVVSWRFEACVAKAVAVVLSMRRNMIYCVLIIES